MNAISILVSTGLTFANTVKTIFNWFFIPLEIRTFPISFPVIGQVAGSIQLDIGFTPIELMFGPGLIIMLCIIVLRGVNPIV